MGASFEVAEAYADFHVNVDKGIDKAIADIKKRANQLDVKAKLTLDMDTKRVQAELDKLGLKTLKPKIQPELDRSAMAKAGKETEDAMSKVAARSNAKFSALAFGALSLGLPAAAAVGVAGVTASLAALPVAAIAAGALLQKSNVAIENSYRQLGGQVRGQLEQMSSVMQGPILQATGQMNAAFQRSAPLISQAFANAAPMVEPLVGAVTDLAESALPGMVAALGKAGPALQGVRTFAGQAGTGLSEFFRNASEGAVGAQQGFEVFGGTVRLLESRLGTLFANLANGSSGPLTSLHTIVDQVTQGLNRLTASGSGGMAALQGFTNVGGGLATVLNGVLGAVSALPPAVGQFAGSLGAATMIASKFGIDAGAGFQGLGQKVRDAGKDMQGAERAGAKFGTAIGGLAAGALNPAFLAVTALGVGLDILGQEQQKASQRAAQHAENVRGLTNAIRQDGGAIGQHADAFNLEALQSKNAAANLGVYGQNLGIAKNAINGNTSAMNSLEAGTRSYIETQLKNTGLSKDTIQQFKDAGVAALSSGKSYDQLDESLSSTLGTFSGGGAKIRSNIEALINGNAAVGEQVKAQREAKAAYLASESALTGLSVAQVQARDATAEHTAAIFEQMNAQLGVRGATLNTKQAITEMNKVNKDSKASEDDKAAALLNVENAMSRQISAAGALAVSNAGQVSDSQKLAVQSAAQNAEALKLAATWAGPLPASLQTAISKMSATDVQAAGLKLSVNNLGQAVVQLPNGKNIVLTSTAAVEIARMEQLRDAINRIPTNKKSTVEIVTIYSQVGTAAVRTGAGAPDVYLYGPHSATGGLAGQGAMQRLPGFAGGGSVGALNVLPGGKVKGPGTTTSDSILAALSDDEMVINAKDTAANMAELYAINAGQRDYNRYPLTGVPPLQSASQSAAKELLDHITRGGQIYEDLSFKGASQNSHDQNDTIARQFYADGGNYENRNDLANWLTRYINGATVQAATAAASSAVESAAPAMVAAAGKPFKSTTAAGGSITINVYQQPGQDPFAFAQQVGRILEQNRKVA